MSSLLERLLSRSAPNGAPQMKKGGPFTRIKDKDVLYFETEFFKYAAAPQYLIRYWLENNSPKWSCTCPDFVHRRRTTNTMCKHCSGAAILVRPSPTPFVLTHLHTIPEDSYNLMLATPIGQPLTIFGQSIRIRVEISGPPGYIAFANRKWRCYTCGGARFHRDCVHGASGLPIPTA